ncbi:hypothetical protein DFH06DRAFT_991412 [Mycena polygramma]|nr:hypothetical protein DFH06DRAFT_1009834 [Mycena polygramma]KAJ7656922.1 hypothetical protein DFH06DRAFT_991412 [Mycena polygramma]
MPPSYAHAEGGNYSHSPAQAAQVPQQPVADPTLQASIDADFVPTPLVLSQDNNFALCTPHGLEKCVDCGVDYANLNRLSKIFVRNPTILCPPPSNVISQRLTQMVTSTKDEGNALFKEGDHVQAIQKYSMAASIAVQRPPWEASQFMCEELSTVISNRSAAYLEVRDYIAALADAEMVIALRKNWSRGHLRKAKTLGAMGRLGDAAEALRLGLAFDTSSVVCAALPSAYLLP